MVIAWLTCITDDLMIQFVNAATKLRLTLLLSLRGVFQRDSITQMVGLIVLKETLCCCVLDRLGGDKAGYFTLTRKLPLVNTALFYLRFYKAAWINNF